MSVLKKLIDQVLDVERTSANKEPRFRPSSLGSKCLRKLYYNFTNTEEDFPLSKDVKRIVKLGEHVHEMLSDLLRKTGCLIDYKREDGSVNYDLNGKVDYEFPLKDSDLKISGKIDAVLKIQDKIWIGEYKSINAFGFSNLTKPKDEHLVQASIYLKLFNKFLKEGKFSHITELNEHSQAEGVIFLYYNKNTSQIKEFKVSNIDQTFLETIERMEYIKTCYESKILPEKTDDWCKSCPYRLKCENNKV